jgi:flagellar M-ring protein FliF
VDAKQFLARLTSLSSALTPTQMLTIGASFLAVVALVAGSAYYLNSSSYALLFSDLDAESAADAVSRLKTQKVPYQLDAGGRSIRVPASRVDELRLEFAGQGLPSSGRVGFEIFDRTAFGATEFLEHMNYRRALEGEIARTITTLSEVSGARVHIAMAKDSLFSDREQPAKASVVLKLRNASRPLAPATVNGIASLVASSVEGLRPDSVVIMDSFGRPLLRPEPGSEDAVDGLQLEKQQRLERDLATRVVSLLEPVVGAARVRVNVSARLNPRSLDETEERWDPGAAVVRSRQAQSDGSVGVPGASSGIAGARANLPPAATPPAATPAAATPPAPAGAAPASPAPAAAGGAVPAGSVPAVVSAAIGVNRSAETTNYEISRSVRHSIYPSGDVARISVAVLVDNVQASATGANGQTKRTSTPRTPAELQKIQGIVAAAVGLDATRGDQLTVENIPFDEVAEEPTVAPSAWQRYAPQALEGARVGAVLLLGLAALFFVVRPAVRRSLGAPQSSRQAAQLPQTLPRTVGDLQNDIEAQLQAAEAKALEPRKVAALTKRLAAMTQKEPENAARLIRAWLTEQEGR